MASDLISKETDELSPRTGGKKQTLSYTMKVSIKPPSTHTSNEVNIATAINNNGNLSQSAQQSTQQQLYPGQQPVYETTP